jgi:hypothetical protein
VDDTFVILQKGPDKLEDFLHHLNSIHQYIRFTMKTESAGHLSFLGLDIYRKPESSLGHEVYRKPTYTNLYLNDKAYRCPPKKQEILSTLVHSARALCCEVSLQAELVVLGDVFKQNGYNSQQIQTALHSRPHLDQPDNKPNLVAFLPFFSIIFNRISRMMARHIKSVGLTHMKLCSPLRYVKDRLGLRISGMYRTPCGCDRVYIRQVAVL